MRPLVFLIALFAPLPNFAQEPAKSCQDFADIGGFSASEVERFQKITLENVRNMLISGTLLQSDFYNAENIAKTYCAYNFQWDNKVYDENGNLPTDLRGTLMRKAHAGGGVGAFRNEPDHIHNNVNFYLKYKNQAPDEGIKIYSSGYVMDNNFSEGRWSYDLIVQVFGEPQSVSNPLEKVQASEHSEPASWYGDKRVEYVFEKDDFTVHASFLFYRNFFMRHNATVTRVQPF